MKHLVIKNCSAYDQLSFQDTCAFELLATDDKVRTISRNISSFFVWMSSVKLSWLSAGTVLGHPTLQDNKTDVHGNCTGHLLHGREASILRAASRLASFRRESNARQGH